uniref:Uncharacterized protein n=1 Tax=Arundo donax TaxID=35708 RepID=A0A0A9AIE9_ARUDO
MRAASKFMHPVICSCGLVVVVYGLMGVGDIWAAL